MTSKDPMDNVRKILADMKESGVTISYRPAQGGPDSPGDRAMGVIHQEARKLGMTYGDEDEAQGHWNGLSTQCLRGTAVVRDDPRFPEYWARTEGIVGERIEVVQVDLERVNFGGGLTWLDNRDGSGWAKVTSGGSPRGGHRDVSIVPFSFEPHA